MLCLVLFFCGQQCCTCIPIIFFLITLQEKIDTVTLEGVESIKIKTEEDFMQSVWTVKSEQEVSVLC